MSFPTFSCDLDGISSQLLRGIFPGFPSDLVSKRNYRKFSEFVTNRERIDLLNENSTLTKYLCESKHDWWREYLYRIDSVKMTTSCESCDDKNSMEDNGT